jgi:FHA domain-containing protein
MAQPAEGVRLPRRVVARRSRKRWTVVFCVAASWVVLYGFTGSMLGATVLLLLIAAFGGACLVALRTLGINSSHPWVQQLASRPWRDGQDVLRLSLRHLTDVFVITPRGSLLAPNAVELRMNPRDFASLTDLMDIGLINSSAAEVYAEQVAAHGAQFGNPGPAEVDVVSDPDVPEGRYRLQQSRAQQSRVQQSLVQQSRVQQRWVQPDQLPPAQPFQPGLAQPGVSQPGVSQPGVSQPGVSQPGQSWPDLMPRAQAAGDPGRQAPPENGPHLVRHTPGDPWPFAHDGRTAAARAATMAPVSPAAVSPAAVTAPTPPGAMAVPGLPTMAETSRPAVPPLRLVSGQSVVETWTSGARAGRGAVELVLPDVPTVSREHARFTFADGRWWVANLGLNGLTLNGVPLAGEQPVSDGDTIRWGRSGNTLVSRVEIG